MEGFTGGGESRRPAELGAAAKEGSGLGFAAGNGNGPGADKEKGEERVKGRHGSRRWPARGAEAEDGRRRATRAGGALETERGREEAADRWARRGFSFSFSFFFLGCDTLRLHKPVPRNAHLSVPISLMPESESTYKIEVLTR